MRNLLIILTLVTLCSCQKTKEIFGLGDNKPLDEFSVVKTKKLEVPPDFELRPPLEEGKKEETAKEADKEVTGKGETNILEQIDNNKTEYTPTKTDEKFLEKVGG